MIQSYLYLFRLTRRSTAAVENTVLQFGSGDETFLFSISSRLFSISSRRTWRAKLGQHGNDAPVIPGKIKNERKDRDRGRGAHAHAHALFQDTCVLTTHGQVLHMFRHILMLANSGAVH